MLLIDDTAYYETLDILRSKKALLPIYAEIKAFIENLYSVRVVNFLFEKMKFSNSGCRPRLQVFLMSAEDYKKMFNGYNYGAEKQKTIANKFIELNKKYCFCPPEDLRNLFVCYSDFCKEMRCDVSQRASKEAIPRLKQKYSRLPIWNITMGFGVLYVFFDTDDQANEYRQNILFQQIKQDYYATLRKYDEFDVFSLDNSDVVFDSKETVDRDYAGSMFYYFR